MLTSLTASIKKFLRILICRSHLHHILRRIYKHKIVILMYHNFYDENHKDHTNVSLDVSIFEKQLKYLKTYYNPIGLQGLVNYIQNGVSIPQNAVVLAFDDGYMNNFTLAYPLLQKYQVPTTIFLTAKFLANNVWIWVNTLEYIISKTTERHFMLSIPEYGLCTFDINDGEKKIKVYKHLKEIFKNFHPTIINKLIIELQDILHVKIDYSEAINYRMLDESAIRTMSSTLVDFGSHTLTHPILTNLDTQECLHEIGDSKKILEKIVGKEIDFFCYPNGNYNKEIVSIVEKYYKAALTTDSGFTDRKSDILLLPRIAAKANFDHFVWSLVHPET